MSVEEAEEAARKLAASIKEAIARIARNGKSEIKGAVERQKSNKDQEKNGSDHEHG